MYASSVHLSSYSKDPKIVAAACSVQHTPGAGMSWRSKLQAIPTRWRGNRQASKQITIKGKTSTAHYLVGAQSDAGDEKEWKAVHAGGLQVLNKIMVKRVFPLRPGEERLLEASSCKLARMPFEQVTATAESLWQAITITWGQDARYACATYLALSEISRSSCSTGRVR